MPSYLGLTGFHERRRYPRATTALNYIKVGDGNGGILMNIGEEGMALTTAEGLIGEFVPLLRFRLSQDGNWIEASARIVWLNDSKKGAGIEFVEISDEDREEIRRWVHSKISPEEEKPVKSAQKPSKEFESALITGPSVDARAAEEPYEIQEPSLRKMFPSENEVQPESAPPIAAREAELEQAENAAAPHETRPQDYFPSEAEMQRKREDTAIPASAQIESHVQFGVESYIQTKTNAANANREPAKVKESIPARERPRIEIDATDQVAASAVAKHAEAARVDDAPPRRLRIPTFGYEPAGDEIEETGSSWRNWRRPTATSSLMPDADESRARALAAPSPRVPSFGYEFSSDQKEEDWTKWVDPAAPSRRSHVRLAVVGVLLIVVAFTIGISFGQGSLDGLIETVKEHIPDRFQQTPNTSNVAESTAPESSMATSAPVAPDVTHIPKSTPSTPSAETPASPTADAGASSSDKDAAGKTTASDAAINSSSTTDATKKDAPPASSAPSPKRDSRSTRDVAKNDAPRTNDARNAAKGDVTRSNGARNSGARNSVARNDSASAPAETGTVLVAATGNSKMPFRLTTEERAISASSWVAISSQASVLVPRATDSDSAPKRLKPGVLVFRVDPAYPKKVGRNEVQIVKLLATVGENGEVRNVQRLSGTPLFASAAISAVREWRYSPTLFDGRPVPTEQKITVAFRSR